MAYKTRSQGLVGLVPRSTTTSYTSVLPAVNQRDWPIFAPSGAKNVSGTVHVPGGAPAVGVTVKLVRQLDDKVVQAAVTNASGQYLFPRDATDVFTYYVLAYDTAAPQQHGVSDRGVTPQ
jgi:hypothetical protein